MALTLEKANRVAEGAIARARQLNAAISVAVCDADGRLIVLSKMDGAFATANQGSIGKAIAAAATGRPSGERAIAVDFSLRTGTVIGEGAPVVARQGGLPIMRKGAICGACGVSGGKDNAQDEDCARAGIDALAVEERRVS